MSIEIINRGRFIEAKDPIGLELGMEGWFTLAAVRNGKIVRSREFKEHRVGPFHNLILNVGMNALTNATGDSVLGMIAVGTGTSTDACACSGRILLGPEPKRPSSGKMDWGMSIALLMHPSVVTSWMGVKPLSGSRKRRWKRERKTAAETTAGVAACPVCDQPVSSSAAEAAGRISVLRRDTPGVPWLGLRAEGGAELSHPPNFRGCAGERRNASVASLRRRGWPLTGLRCKVLTCDGSVTSVICCARTSNPARSV